jgi:hypothetical protein
MAGARAFAPPENPGSRAPTGRAPTGMGADWDGRRLGLISGAAGHMLFTHRKEHHGGSEMNRSAHPPVSGRAGSVPLRRYREIARRECMHQG